MPPSVIDPALISLIYEAALQPDGLRLIAELLREALDVGSAGVWLTENGVISELSVTDDITESQKPYLDYYYKLDVWGFDAQTKIDQPILGSDFISANDLQKTEFYNEFARKFGLSNPLGAALAIAPGNVATIATDRQSRKLAYQPEDKATLRELIPHIKSALKLRVRSLSVDRPFSGAAALDAFAFGAVVCSASSHVIHTNAAAEALLSQQIGGIVRRKDRKIVAAFAIEGPKLARMIHAAATEGRAGSLTLSDKTGARALIALITPVPAGTLQQLGPNHALIALRETDAMADFTTIRLTELFKLSPAQAALAIALYQGKSFEEIAADRGVKISTLRTHFAEVLNRTGAKGLRDLVRLLGTIPPLR